MDFIQRTKQNIFIRLFGLARIPLLYFVSPRVIDVSDERCEIEIPLLRRNKNHLGSMYFGALCIGADIAGGLLAMSEVERLKKQSGVKIQFVFKDFKAEFLKRPTRGVRFISKSGKRVRELVAQAAQSPERVNEVVEIEAFMKKGLKAQELEKVAHFWLTLSLKQKKGQKI